MAKNVGVKNPENVRILEINEIPLPNNTHLKKLGEEKGLFNSNLAGITFGYGVYIRKENIIDEELISHELRHVYQFENEESLEIYLQKYINELLEYGYNNAPYEIDARVHSINIKEKNEEIERINNFLKDYCNDVMYLNSIFQMQGIGGIQNIFKSGYKIPSIKEHLEKYRKDNREEAINNEQEKNPFYIEKSDKLKNLIEELNNLGDNLKENDFERIYNNIKSIVYT